MTAAQEWSLVERRRQIMASGMSVHVAVPPEDEKRAESAISDCLAWLEEIGRSLTRFDPASELSQLNQAAGSWRAVSDTLYTVVEQSVAAAEATNGLFHPATLPALEAAGYDRDYDEIAQREIGTRIAPPPLIDWREIALDPIRRRIRLPVGAGLDLGGIVKGWAADVALERFFSGLENVLINASGDMRARGGAQPSELWAVGIGDPHAPSDGEDEARNVTVVTLGQGGTATSGATERWWYADSVAQHHVIDPRIGAPARIWLNTGEPAPEGADLIATATAFAPTAAHAEVAAKVALLRGYPEAIERVARGWKSDRQRPRPPYGDVDVALLLVMGSGAVHVSAHLEAWLDRYGGGGSLWLS
ncbi:MAG TPA: FAD:protein FMN transferase [Ktedonobacterales bacterium]|jgi:thiamine biosynthesis lipoprotein